MAVANKTSILTTLNSADLSLARVGKANSSTSQVTPFSPNKTRSLQGFHEGASDQKVRVETDQGTLTSSQVTPGPVGHTEIPSARTPELTSRAKAIALACCMCISFLCTGFSLGLGVVFVQILDVFNTTRAQTSLMQSLCIGFIYAGALICGPIVQKLGPGNSVILGGLLSLVGCVGASLAPNVEVLIITVGFITGIGLCFAFFSSYMVVSQVLTKNKGMGVSLITAGSGLGSFLYPQINRLILDAYGWRGLFLLLAGVNFNIGLLGFMIRCLTKPLFLTKPSKTDLKRTSKSFNVHVFKNVPYTIFLFCQLPIWMFHTGLSVFIVDIAENRGYSLESASLLLSALTIATVAGSLLGGILDSVLHIPALLSSSAALLVCGPLTFAFVYFHDYGVMVALAIGNGAVIGMVDVCIPIAVHQLCGPAMYSAALSFFFGLSGLSDILSGPVNGAIRDTTGDYLLMFYLAGGVALVMGVVFLCLELWMRRAKSTLKDVYISRETVDTKL